MAVVQISRIQVRRGRKNVGTGFPQLASGELGWAIDTQELYIGNGSVSEGAPAVGNTKIITEYDIKTAGVLLASLQHSYGSNNPDINVVTGPDDNNPTARSVQSVLDDRVNLLSFGAGVEGTIDYSEEFQRAVDQLFLNPSSKSSLNTADGISTRVVLELPAGQFNISSTIYVPSYANIVGAGSDKTIINYTGSGSVFQFVNDTSTIGSPSSITSTHSINQPRYITLRGFTVITSTDDQSCLQLDAVKNSTFDDLKLVGNWGNLFQATSKGIALNASPSMATCQYNKFSNISISGFTYGVFSKQDVNKNIFDNFEISDTFKGISFGEGSNGSYNQKYGPCDNTISNIYLWNIMYHGIYIERGTNNVIENCKLDNVGNEGGGHVSILYPQIHLQQVGNICNNIRSDRSGVLTNLSYYVQTRTLTLSSPVTAMKDSYVQQASTNAYGTLVEDVNNSNTITLQNLSPQQFNTVNNLTIDNDSTPSTTNTVVYPTVIGSLQTSNYIPYIPEISGHGVFKVDNIRTTALGSPSVYSSVIRLPVSTDQYGVQQNSILYKVAYQYNSVVNTFIRGGILSISADIENASVKLVDEYDYTGSDPTGLTSLKLNFRVRLLDQTGLVYTGGIDQYPRAISIEYVNTLSGDNGVFSYTYTASF